MGHFSMEIYAPNGSNLSGNQQSCLTFKITFPRVKKFGFAQAITGWHMCDRYVS